MLMVVMVLGHCLEMVREMFCGVFETGTAFLMQGVAEQGFH